MSLTPTPAGGSVFAGWSGACTGTGSCQVTMNAAKSVTATFALAMYSLNVTTTGAGQRNRHLLSRRHRLRRGLLRALQPRDPGASHRGPRHQLELRRLERRLLRHGSLPGHDGRHEERDGHLPARRPALPPGDLNRDGQAGSPVAPPGLGLSLRLVHGERHDDVGLRPSAGPRAHEDLAGPWPRRPRWRHSLRSALAGRDDRRPRRLAHERDEDGARRFHPGHQPARPEPGVAEPAAARELAGQRTRRHQPGRPQRRDLAPSAERRPLRLVHERDDSDERRSPHAPGASRTPTGSCAGSPTSTATATSTCCGTTGRPATSTSGS